MATKIPAFSYTGQYRTEMRGGYWYIYLLTGGTFQFAYAKTADICCVGGGAGGQNQASPPHGDRSMPGGIGGAVVHATGQPFAANTNYVIAIGAGGSRSGAGGTSSVQGMASAAGGASWPAMGAGQAGANGTHAFGDASLPRYGAQGGAGGWRYSAGGDGGADGGGKGGGGGGPGYKGADAIAGAANTGSGGGGAGCYYYDDEDSRYNGAHGDAAPGGSGVVILRGTQDDNIPVAFNGTQLAEIVFNGTKITGLIYNGTRIFARAMQRAARPLRRMGAARCLTE